MKARNLTLKCPVNYNFFLKNINKQKIKKDFLEPGAFSSNTFSNIAGPVTFLLWLRMLVYFLNDVDIQLILEFRNSIEKCYPVCSKIPNGLMGEGGRASK